VAHILLAVSYYKKFFRNRVIYKNQLGRKRMDRPIIKTSWQRLQKSIVAVLSVIVLIIFWVLAAPKGGKTLNVKGEKIQIAKVTQGLFEDFTPLQGQVTPLRTVYLDSIEGGKVERVYLEDGAEVSLGQPIVDFSNTRLQLDFIGQEAQVSEQINNMQTQELNLARNELEHRSNLNDLTYQIHVLQRKIKRIKPLIETGNIAISEADSVQDELDYARKKQALIIKARVADNALQKAQMKQLNDSVSILKTNLQFARENLEALKVRAPIPGRLTAFNIEVGQSLKPGERFGQIDDPQHFKLMSQVDEFYMSRVFIGQTAEMNFAEKTYLLEVKKIYPQVKDGQFRVDFIFHDSQPEHLSRGQSMQIRLQLGKNMPAKMIPNGSFYQATNGFWIFVIAANQKIAVRRSIRLGRRNNNFIEVLDGLDIGEQVVVSPYTDYLDMDRLNIE
jgi:HlyD family secretion protein